MFEHISSLYVRSLRNLTPGWHTLSSVAAVQFRSGGNMILQSTPMIKFAFLFPANKHYTHPLEPDHQWFFAPKQGLTSPTRQNMLLQLYFYYKLLRIRQMLVLSIKFTEYFNRSLTLFIFCRVSETLFSAKNCVQFVPCFRYHNYCTVFFAAYCFHCHIPLKKGALSVSPSAPLNNLLSGN